MNHRDRFREDDREPPAPHRARKNRRRWCRGKVGVDHKIKTELHKPDWWKRLRGESEPRCYYSSWKSRRTRKPHWICNHRRVCTECGKILESTLGTDCPKYQPAAEDGRAPHGGQ